MAKVEFVEGQVPGDEIAVEQYYSTRLSENDFDREYLLSNPEGMAKALEDLPTQGAVSISLLNENACNILLQEAEKLEFRRCRDVIGDGEKAVTQDFSISLNFSKKSRLDEFAAAFERQLNKAFEIINPQPFPTPFHFNDRAMLIYEKDSTGISPHRDLVCFHGVVAILTLVGEADFYICDDRHKTNSRHFKASQGEMIIMRGVNYAGMDDRPFHYVENVNSRRVGFGLRYNATDSLRGGPE